MKQYYEAYDDRYRQVHSLGLRWASAQPTPIVAEVIRRFAIKKSAPVLEIGCGEGRDAAALLRQGYDLLATDISQEAIAWCRKKYPADASRFQQLDCLKDRLDSKFSVIYAVAVLHMLVLDRDRHAFYRFFREQLTDSGIGLICTMGDGERESFTDIEAAFDLQPRVHQQSGKTISIAGTSCRMVSAETLKKELKEAGLRIFEMGLTEAPPEFSQLMYAVVGKAS